MRRIGSGILLAMTVLAAVAADASAKAHEPVDFEPFGVGAGVWCSFPVNVGVVENKEFQDVVTLADGTTITRIRGKLVLSFTNASTGFTIVRNVSGPTTETDHPGGTGILVAEGNNWFAFGPTSRRNTGQPGLVFTSGLVVLELDLVNHVVTGFTHHGKQVNGCDLLGTEISRVLSKRS